MDLRFSFKELYDVTLKATYPIDIDGQEVESGEVVAVFDRIQISNFNEVKSLAVAQGGFDNAPRVFWESTKDVQLKFTQGVFSKVQLALMSNSNLVRTAPDKTVLISKREFCEAAENGSFTLEQQPVGKIFVYEKDGKKMLTIDAQEGERTYNPGYSFIDLIIDYVYEYKNNSTRLIVGQRLTNGFLSLQGKTRVKDDVTGQVKTGIINIPKLKLMSELSMRLGEKADPLLGQLQAIACPTGTRNNPIVMELVFLDDDIDSDM